jgi:hypothetical protein
MPPSGASGQITRTALMIASLRLGNAVNQDIDRFVAAVE